MKIEYDVDLYRKMATFDVNKMVQVQNRKGHRSTIHITQITKLSWHELQLLVSSGADKFTKMYLLYQELATERKISSSVINGYTRTVNEEYEISKYIEIFRKFNCREHYEANEIITQQDRWDEFKTIRSLNDHGKHKEIPGIQPKYFEIICNILKITGSNGHSLDNYEVY